MSRQSEMPNANVCRECRVAGGAAANLNLPSFPLCVYETELTGLQRQEDIASKSALTKTGQKK